MGANGLDFTIGIGGAAGQGIATPGNILARIFVRRGLHLYSYNAHQSIIRGGHSLLMLRLRDQEVHSHGDGMDLLLCLNQDTMDRHVGLLRPGSRVLYNSDTIEPGEVPDDVLLCPMPIGDLKGDSKNKLIQNTISLGVIMFLTGLDFSVLAQALELLFGRKGPAVVEENLTMARAGYDYAAGNFEPFPVSLPEGGKPLAMWAGNDAMAMGGAAAGVKFYAAYPMSPATGVLHWMARHAHELGIMVRQVEDEIGVANMAIGAAHVGCRAMCATSGGGFALMTEAVGAAAMMEIPVVFINVMRAGPSTGVPTKTEQGDLWQVLGASQGDFERFIVLLRSLRSPLEWLRAPRRDPRAGRPPLREAPRRHRAVRPGAQRLVWPRRLVRPGRKGSSEHPGEPYGLPASSDGAARRSLRRSQSTLVHRPSCSRCTYRDDDRALGRASSEATAATATAVVVLFGLVRPIVAPVPDDFVDPRFTGSLPACGRARRSRR